MIPDELIFNEGRTEEVQSIVDKMPTNFGYWTTLIVIFIFLFLILFGWCVSYPDMISGQITLSNNTSPVKLIAHTAGKLKLNRFKSLETVKEGDVVAYIDNSSALSDVILIDSLLKNFGLDHDKIESIFFKLPKKTSFGEINSKYFAFVQSLERILNFYKDKLLQKQKDNYIFLLKEQNNSVSNFRLRETILSSSLKFLNKFYHRDSILFINKVLSESELDKSKLSLFSSRDAYQNAVSDLISSKQQARVTQGKIQELQIELLEKEKSLRLELTATFNDLTAQIRDWEMKYVFRSPIDGNIQFLKFYTENQFVQSGEAVFSIIPKRGKVIGNVFLPSSGLGKIREGQEVIVKLDNFPYREYGSLSGTVESIAITSSTIRTEKSEMDTYLVSVSFPKGLNTNYGNMLHLKAEAKGTAEIIAQKRRLIERLFDNLRYLTVEP